MALVAVTGANGHVGANLVRELLRRGRRVRVLVHRRDDALDGLDVERVHGDVVTGDGLGALLEGADVLYHLAAVISIDGDREGLVRRTNVEGVRNVMAAARECRVRRVVHMSSVHAFAQEPLDEPLDETRARVSPRYPAYDRSKAAGEIEVRAAIAHGLDAVIVNPTGILGPFDFGPSRMGRFFLDLHRRRLPALIAGGFDWVDVRDVVAATLAAEEHGRTGESYLVGGHWHSLAEIAAFAHDVAGVDPPRWTCPMSLARLGAPWAAAWSRILSREPLFTTESLHALRSNRRIAHDKAARELRHAPRPVRETVGAVYGWFAAAGVVAAHEWQRETYSGGDDAC